MKKFDIFYANDPTFFPIDDLKVEDIVKTHTYLFDIEAETLGEVFYKMQGDVWSPNGEARDFIKNLGLHHTSMSVGDIIYDVEENTYYQVNHFGFKKVEG